MLNSRDIHLLRPDVAANCQLWLQRCREAGMDVCITSTVRDLEYQGWLYEQGRSRPGAIVTNGRRPTFHWDQAGLAFDFCQNRPGDAYSDVSFFRRAAALAKEMGFSWGGDWKLFPDSPHLQWDHGGRWTGAMILRGELPPAMPLWKPSQEEPMERYNTLAQCPDWSRPAIRRLLEQGLLTGTGGTDDQGLPAGLDLSRDMVRLLVIWDRQQTLSD